MADELLIVSATEQIVLLGDVATEVIDLTQVHELREVAQQGPAGVQGPVGLSGSAVSSYIAAVNVSGHTAIVLDVLGRCLPADAAAPTHYAVAGLTTQAAVAGSPVEVVTKGVLEHLGWTLTPGLPVFLGLDGALTQTIPPTALFSKALGIALSPTRISIDFQPAIFI